MKIFISYASAELRSFRIPEIATRLENTKEIDRVFYWDRDSTAQKSIVKYMEDSISASDVILIVCTEASNKSGPVQQETDMAVYLNKRIVPIFQDINDVRLSLRPKRGVRYFKDDFDSFFTDLFMVATETLPEIPQELESAEFHGISLAIDEYRAMKSLEEQLGVIFPPIEPFCVETIKNAGRTKYPLASKITSGIGFVAVNNHVIQLTFSRKLGIKEQPPPPINFVPEALSHLLFLRALDMKSQNISVIPPFIGKLTQLEYLDVSQNKIQNFPVSLSQLQSLKVFLFFNDLISTHGRITLSNYTLLQSLLNNKCKVDDKFNKVIWQDHPDNYRYHKKIYCVYCGHGFDFDQPNPPLKGTKILCPISKHENFFVFGVKTEEKVPSRLKVRSRQRR